MILTLENVGKNYGVDVIIQEVSAIINSGDRIGVIGENGAGKTTLLNVILGLLDNDEGRIIFNDNVTVGYLKQMEKLNPNNTVYTEMQTVYSDVFDAIEKMKNIEGILNNQNDTSLNEEYQLLENLVLSKDGYNTDFKIKKMLNGMGFFATDYEKQVSVLSGGEQTRLNLAKLLLLDPDVLILDEPTNHLDFDTLVWLEDYLISYKGCIISVSHDRFFLDKVCNRIWELEDSYFYEYKGNYSSFEMQKEEKLKVQQRQYEEDLEKAIKLQDYVDRNLVRASTSKMAKSRRKTLEKMEMTKKPKNPRVPLKFNFEIDSTSYDEVLIVENLNLSAGNKELLIDLNLDLRRGERLIIAGANGTGKTTLINTLAGKTRPKSGKIKIGSGTKMSLYSQHVDVVNTSVIENIWALRPKWTQLEVRSYLARFGYRNEDVFKEAVGLSGGEKARLRFCQMSLDKANLLFMDEPTNHLDIYMRKAVTDALANFEGTLVVITHDRYLMQQLNCPIINIENKAMVKYNDFEDFINKGKTLGFKTQKEEKTVKINQNNQKQQRKQTAQDRLNIKKYEKEIEEIQEKTQEIEKDMQNPDIAKDPVMMQKLWEEMQKYKDRNDELFLLWAQLLEKLEN